MSTTKKAISLQAAREANLVRVREALKHPMTGNQLADMFPDIKRERLTKYLRTLCDRGLADPVWSNIDGVRMMVYIPMKNDAPKPARVAQPLLEKLYSPAPKFTGKPSMVHILDDAKRHSTRAQTARRGMTYGVVNYGAME